MFEVFAKFTVTIKRSKMANQADILILLYVSVRFD